MSASDAILAVFRPPFGFTPTVARLPEGLTLAELCSRMPGLPPDFSERGTICICGQPTPRALWHAIRPRRVLPSGVPVEVTFHAPPMGGGDGDGKQILAIVASIALTAVTGSIVAKGVKFLGIAAKSTAAYALAVGVSYIGSLALSALTRPPALAQTEAPTRERERNAAAEGNLLSPDGGIPRVVGERKVFPPFAMEPLTYFDGPDERVEAVYALAGPHRMTDIRVGNAPIGTLGVEFEIREGWPGDPPLTLVRRHGRTEAIQGELRGHVVLDSAPAALDTTDGDLSAALPQPYVMVTRREPDEHWLQVAFAQGLHLKASDTDRLRVPLRLRIREVGAAEWINLPELHFQAAAVRQMRATIILDWRAGNPVAPSVASAEGFVEARRESPGQTIAPETEGWVAHAAFGASGDAWMSGNNLASTGVQNVICDRYTARFCLDPATFPKGRYEIEIRRGMVFKSADYTPATYEIGGVVWDLFHYQGTSPVIVMSRDGVSDALYLLRSVSVWNERPVAAEGLALIAVRARNRNLDSVSCVAGGWVRDWDGTGWRQWAVTDNPAPHLRDILAGDLNASPVPARMVDDASLLDWRAAGHRCNAILEGLSAGEAAELVAACGYARPYMSEVYGVARDYDRSAESPVQIFTPRNARALSWSKAFARLPDALRVTFRDETRDYEERQVMVLRPGFIGAPRLIEQVAYEGLTTEQQITQRAEYDLRQGEMRSVFYTLGVPAEAVICRRGDLVGLQHDMLSEQAGYGRVTDWWLNTAGQVAGLVLDCSVPVLTRSDVLASDDLLAEPDMLTLGARTAVVLRGASGPSLPIEVTADAELSDRLTLATPVLASEVYEGALAIVGPAEGTMLRLIVQDVQPEDDLTATLTLVPEAPGLWAA